VLLVDSDNQENMVRSWRPACQYSEVNNDYYRFASDDCLLDFRGCHATVVYGHPFVWRLREELPGVVGITFDFTVRPVPFAILEKLQSLGAATVRVLRVEVDRETFAGNSQGDEPP